MVATKLQAYYPERLGMLFIIHVPKVFWGGWKLVYPFIDKVTREKVIYILSSQLIAIGLTRYQCLKPWYACLYAYNLIYRQHVIILNTRNTQQKFWIFQIVFVEDKLIEEKLREEIENDQIPDIYGGGVALVPIQNVALVNQPPRVASSV